MVSALQNISFQAQVNQAKINGSHQIAKNYYTPQLKGSDLTTDKFEYSNKKTETPVKEESSWSKMGKTIGNGIKSLATKTVESFAKSAGEELIRSAANSI